MKERAVTVTGGGKNLYKVSEYSGKFGVYHASVKLFSTNLTKIGETRSLEDALTLIRSHSGRSIDQVKSW